jgi:hypothetical protein
MAVAEETDQHAVHQPALADDPGGDVLAEGLELGGVHLMGSWREGGSDDGPLS